MTSANSRVSSDVRDRLKRQAAAHSRTMGEHLEALLDDEARNERFRELRVRMAASPPNESYLQGATRWQRD